MFRRALSREAGVQYDVTDVVFLAVTVLVDNFPQDFVIRIMPDAHDAAVVHDAVADTDWCSLCDFLEKFGNNVPDKFMLREIGHVAGTMLHRGYIAVEFDDFLGPSDNFSVVTVEQKIGVWVAIKLKLVPDHGACSRCPSVVHWFSLPPLSMRGTLTNARHPNGFCMLRSGCLS